MLDDIQSEKPHTKPRGPETEKGWIKNIGMKGKN